MGDRHSFRRIGLLIAWAALVQACVIARNSVPAQDATGFIQFARQLDHRSVVETLRNNTQHPLYPILVWGQHAAIHPLFSSEGTCWIRSAQLVAGLAAILLVVPMYLAGVRLSNPFLATSATVLFSTLPFIARLGADALADSTYLLFMLTGIWGCMEFLVSRRHRWLFMAGLAAGLAFLARPEALLLPMSLAATLAIVQWRRDWRMPWRSCVIATVTAAGGLVSIAAPYTMAIGKLTPKGSLNFLPGGRSLFARFDSRLGRPAERTFSDGTSVPPAATIMTLPVPSHSRLDFSLNHRPDGKRRIGYRPAVAELVRELVEGWHYVLGPLVLVGILCAERRPAHVLCSMLALAFVGVLVQFASQSGYVASRHVLTLIGLGCYAAARGGWVVAGALARTWGGRRGVDGFGLNRVGCTLESRQLRIALALFALAVLCCLPRSFGSLHQSREAHVAAGQWLSQHVSSGSVVLDSRGWASLVAGLPAYDYNGARLAFENPDLAYVILDSEELLDERPRGETLRHLLSAAGEIVAEFPAAGVPDHTVRVYAWHPDRLASNGLPRQELRSN